MARLESTYIDMLPSRRVRSFQEHISALFCTARTRNFEFEIFNWSRCISKDEETEESSKIVIVNERRVWRG